MCSNFLFDAEQVSYPRMFDLIIFTLQTMGVTARYPRAHGDQVLDVSFVDDSTFASCSQDGLVALWDIREKGTKGGEFKKLYIYVSVIWSQSYWSFKMTMA